jgi:hypothetical protein
MLSDLAVSKGRIMSAESVVWCLPDRPVVPHTKVPIALSGHPAGPRTAVLTDQDQSAIGGPDSALRPLTIAGSERVPGAPPGRTARCHLRIAPGRDS